MAPRPDLYLVLVWPEIPWNTGNTARKVNVKQYLQQYGP